MACNPQTCPEDYVQLQADVEVISSRDAMLDEQTSAVELQGILEQQLAFAK